MLWALLSKNSLAVMALCALVGWAHFGIKKHDTKVARAAVAEHTEKAREVVKKAKVAQRRADPDRGMSKYCTDCDPGK